MGTVPASPERFGTVPFLRSEPRAETCLSLFLRRIIIQRWSLYESVISAINYKSIH